VLSITESDFELSYAYKIACILNFMLHQTTFQLFNSIKNWLKQLKVDISVHNTQNLQTK